MNAATSNECFLLTMAGAPPLEIARVKNESVEDVRRAIEKEVADRVNVEEFPSLDDAIEYLRLGRLERGLWSEATNGSAQEVHQVANLMQKRRDLKDSVRHRPLSEAVRNMLSVNNVDLNEEYEDV